MLTLAQALSEEIIWGKLANSLNNGDYTRANSNPNSKAAKRIEGLFRQLADELLTYRRSGFIFPEEPQEGLTGEWGLKEIKETKP